MAKTILTKRIEQTLMYGQFDKRAEACCTEVTVGWYGKEIVDFMTYSLNKKREIKCFEIKVSKADFNSKAKLTFIGNKNYFVMPTELFDEVKDKIPKGIGVYGNNTELIMLGYPLKCLKRATFQKLKEDKEVILSSMLRSMQRELLKERRSVRAI